MVPQSLYEICGEKLNKLEWPAPSGVYFLINNARRKPIVYVGKGNIYDRLYQHHQRHNRVFDEVFQLMSPDSLVGYLEELFIRTFRPLYNKYQYENRPSREIDEDVRLLLQFTNGSPVWEYEQQILSMLESLENRHPGLLRDMNIETPEDFSWDNR